MPYSEKAHAFFALCSTPKGRAKARGKCPPMSDAKRMMGEGIKHSSKPRSKHRNPFKQ